MARLHRGSRAVHQCPLQRHSTTGWTDADGMTLSEQVIKNVALALTAELSLGWHPRHCRFRWGWVWKPLPWTEHGGEKHQTPGFSKCWPFINKYICFHTYSSLYSWRSVYMGQENAFIWTFHIYLTQLTCTDNKTVQASTAKEMSSLYTGLEASTGCGVSPLHEFTTVWCSIY